MQQQARSHTLVNGIPIKRIARNRMSDGIKVHPDLVRTTRFRRQLQHGIRTMRHVWPEKSGLQGRMKFRRIQQAPAGAAGFALYRVDHAARTVGPVHTHGRIDPLPLHGGHVGSAADNRHISFVHLPQGKLALQAALHLQSACQNHQPAGPHIEPVHDQCIVKLPLHARTQAILFLRTAARHGQQAGRFVRNDKRLIDMENF